MFQQTIARLVALSMLVVLVAAIQAQTPAARTSHDLKIVAVDVEGGAAVLFVTAEGKSLLIDTGWAPGLGGPHPAPGTPPPLPPRSESRKLTIF
jgi:hypothetical protein